MQGCKQVFICSLLLLIVINAQAFSWKQLIPSAFFDSQNAIHFGDQPASLWYQDKTQEFLRLLGMEHADQVPVRQLKFSQELKQCCSKTFYDNVSCLTLSTGIWVNEDILNKMSAQTRLWFIAHEAAHYNLGHGMQEYIFASIMQAMPIAFMIGIFGISLLGFHWISNKIEHLKQNYECYQKIFFILTGFYFGSCALTSSRKMALKIQEFQKKCNQKADIAAATMLCDYGYEEVVKIRINALKEAVEGGYILLNNYNTPSFQQQLAYMQDFWDSYHKQHVDVPLD